MKKIEKSRRLLIEPTWKDEIGDQFALPYMNSLRDFLINSKKAGKTIYPCGSEIFSAFNYTPFNKVKVVILGQDPYHGPNQAHGLCFSVKPGVPIPPSLQNIFKELQSDLNISPPDNGSLIPWAKQGVLLLNSVLSVEMGQAASHQGKGWETLTDHIISMINTRKKSVVFLLWGSYAQKKGQIVDLDKHLVLKSPHPSPFSAHRGFFGNRHFSKTNEYLRNNCLDEIDWMIPNNLYEEK